MLFNTIFSPHSIHCVGLIRRWCCHLWPFFKATCNWMCVLFRTRK